MAWSGSLAGRFATCLGEGMDMLFWRGLALSVPLSILAGLLTPELIAYLERRKFSRADDVSTNPCRYCTTPLWDRAAPSTEETLFQCSISSSRRFASR